LTNQILFALLWIAGSPIQAWAEGAASHANP